MSTAVSEHYVYSGDGLHRRHAETGVREKWNGNQWAREVDRKEQAARLNRIKGNGVARTSRDVELSPLGLQRSPTHSERVFCSYDQREGEILQVEDGSLGLGVVEVIQTPNKRDIWLDEETMTRIEDNPRLLELFRDQIWKWEPGMKFLVEDVSYTSFFKDAVAAEEARRRATAGRLEVEVDTLDLLKRKANALVQQAAQYNAEPIPLMAETFGLRLAEVQQELTELESRMEEVRDLVGLASTAVVEALTE